jgi:hypothetical protein
MTTGPYGQAVSIDDRLAEICDRYGPHDLVTQSITLAAPRIHRSAARVEVLLAAQPR